MTPFRLSLHPGESIFDQLVFAAKKAFVSGELQLGQSFPSVRSLAVEFKIHPNTAHKVVQHLIQERWLESRPGIGTVVAEAKRLELDIDDVIQAIEDQWAKLEESQEVSRK